MQHRASRGAGPPIMPVSSRPRDRSYQSVVPTRPPGDDRHTRAGRGHTGTPGLRRFAQYSSGYRPAPTGRLTVPEPRRCGCPAGAPTPSTPREPHAPPLEASTPARRRVDPARPRQPDGGRPDRERRPGVRAGRHHAPRCRAGCRPPRPGSPARRRRRRRGQDARASGSSSPRGAAPTPSRRPPSPSRRRARPTTAGSSPPTSSTPSYAPDRGAGADGALVPQGPGPHGDAGRHRSAATSPRRARSRQLDKAFHVSLQSFSHLGPEGRRADERRRAPGAGRRSRS